MASARTGSGTGSNHAVAPAAEITTSSSFQFELATAALYHRARLSWFSGLHRAGMFLNILAGTGAVASVVSQSKEATLFLALLVAVISAANLAFDFAGCARKHEDARHFFHDLAAELEECPADNSTIHHLRARMIRAGASQPPVYEAVQALAFNAAIRSLGLDKNDEFVLTRSEKFLRHIRTYNGRVFPKRNEKVLDSSGAWTH